jgi:hypothetical protein
VASYIIFRAKSWLSIFSISQNELAIEGKRETYF